VVSLQNETAVEVVFYSAARTFTAVDYFFQVVRCLSSIQH
jgi:hypothetical protein